MTNTQHAQLLDWLRKIDAHCERIADACERAEAQLGAPAAPVQTLQDFGDAGPQVVVARGLRGKRGGRK